MDDFCLYPPGIPCVAVGAQQPLGQPEKQPVYHFRPDLEHPRRCVSLLFGAELVDPFFIGRSRANHRLPVLSHPNPAPYPQKMIPY